MGEEGVAMAESQGVSPQDLSLEQLSQVKKQLEQEVQQLDANLQTFKSVVGKCEESKESLEAIVPENAGKPMLVPLTGSLYCPGKLGGCEKVLVDIGTGYYVRKSGDGARQHRGASAYRLREEKELRERKHYHVTKDENRNTRQVVRGALGSTELLVEDEILIQSYQYNIIYHMNVTK